MSQPSFETLNLRKTPKISDKEFVDLRNFIYESTGIDIPEKRKYLLETRLGTRLKDLSLNTFGDYFNYLKFDPGKTREMENLFQQITTNETSLFRDVKQLQVFEDFVLKDILERQASTKELNIWSAGCSSGEEPYTLGIMLHEALRMAIIGWRVRITANDLSSAMLEKARRGVYNDYAIRTTPPDILNKYFTKETDGYKIHPKVAKLVTFSQINLNDRLALKKIPKSHVVFCRNVIIYFDDEMKKKVISAFYDNLHPDGYLVLGHSESIHKISRSFQPVMKPGGIVYKRMS
ncbi:MAG: protein-glutamate O-methyltransferase CheR [Deltaproteobacteria bacterium]|nr:protein-glutamate O-methyltransferase CheR [Deltaproteobacteria bacterium]